MRFRAHGASMRPFLRHGDVVSVVRVDPAHLAVGDVVCYEREPGRLTLHRVVGRDPAHLVTKGDALDWVESVAADRILGKVTAVERGGRLGRIVTRFVRLARRRGRAGDTVEHG